MPLHGRRMLRYGVPGPSYHHTPLGQNQECFIRKQHHCGKLFGASKSCFIACPTDEGLEPILQIISLMLSKAGIEPIVAVKERAYGQDIFCTKICGKIIEARFCIVILDDSRIDDHLIPNPNVYYEYGLMTSLRKHIIPLQKQDLRLAFNIQSYDTIKYTPSNMSGEIDRAIRDAIRITDDTREDLRTHAYSERLVLRRLERAGFEEQAERSTLAEPCEDTNFVGFVHPEGSFYACVGKVDAESQIQDHLEDLQVIVYRTERIASELRDSIAQESDRLEKLLHEAEQQETIELPGMPHPLSRQQRMYRGLSSVETLQKEIALHEQELRLLDRVYIAFILSPALDHDGFTAKAQDALGSHSRYELAVSDSDALSFGEVTVDLRS